MNRAEKAKQILDIINPNLKQKLDEDWEHFIPGFGGHIVDNAYGEIYSREGLDLKTRQIATVAALTVLGGQTGPQLKANLKHALNAGATKLELKEVILQMSLYGGMPAAINGLRAAKELFDELEAPVSQA